MNEAKNVQNCKKLILILGRTNWIAVIRKLKHSSPQALTGRQSIVAIRRCLQFLILVFQYPDACLVPSKEIDAVIHILEQSSLFHCYFDHQPGLGTRGEADRQKWLHAFQITRELFERHFGVGSMGKANPGSCQVVDYRFDQLSMSIQPAACEVCLRVAEVA